MTSQDFNPLRREGGDSPHLPIWLSSLYFNPLRREGGDGKGGIDRVVVNQFQSTPPRGRRRRAVSPMLNITSISIHSAARAETLVESGAFGSSKHFNPLRREGGDLTQSHRSHIVTDFNPLRREGGDNALDGACIDSGNFNPLRREGGDTDIYVRLRDS